MAEKFSENAARLADEIPFLQDLYYSAIEQVVPETEMTILNRFTDLNYFVVFKPVKDIERFLNLLNNLENIVELQFDQSQDLFDYCHSTTVPFPRLVLFRELSDVGFLSSIKFTNTWHMPTRVFNLELSIQNDSGSGLNEQAVETVVPDLDAAIQFVLGDSRPKKRSGWGSPEVAASTSLTPIKKL